MAETTYELVDPWGNTQSIRGAARRDTLLARGWSEPGDYQAPADDGNTEPTRFGTEEPHTGDSTDPVSPPPASVDYEERTADDLRALLAERGLPTSGNKPVLIEILRQHDEEQATNQQ